MNATMPSFKIAPASANAWAALELRKMWPQLVQRNGSWMNVRLPRLHRPSKTTSKTHQSARQHTSSTLHACRRASEHICCAHARHANPRSHARTHAGTQKPTEDLTLVSAQRSQRGQPNPGLSTRDEASTAESVYATLDHPNAAMSLSITITNDDANSCQCIFLRTSSSEQTFT